MMPCAYELRSYLGDRNRHLKIIRIIIGFLSLWLCASRAEERIWLDGEINDKPVRLVFDTGANKLILFPTAARRLGLKVGSPPKDTLTGPGEVLGGVTEACTVRFHGAAIRTYFNVMDVPAYVRSEEDGVLGWGKASSNIFLIDAVARTVTPLSQVPEDAVSWTRLRFNTNSVLGLELPQEGAPPTVLLVDTGKPNGAALEPGKWRKWKAAHTNQAATIDAYFMPGAGLVIKEEMWAGQLGLGPLLLSDVPVMESNSAEVAAGSSRFEASLGLAALKRLDLVLDGKERVAYVRPKSTRPLPYEHNRLGAVFVPRDSQSDDLVAHVVGGSPAWEAGIRDGDVLLNIEKLDVTRWRSNPAILPLSRFWQRPPGTRLQLTVRRSESTFATTVELRQILLPNGSY